MLVLAVVALGGLTAGVGTLVDSQAADADARRMADGLDRALEGTERTGYHSHEIHFSEGRLRTADRTLRVLEDGTVVATHDIGALVFERGDHRVVSVAGAVVRDNGNSAWLEAAPPLTYSERTGIFVVGVPALAEDRLMSPDLESAARLVRSGALADAAGPEVLPEVFG
jgi:hypothetical protein